MPTKGPKTDALPELDEVDVELVGSGDSVPSSECTLQVWGFTADGMTEQQSSAIRELSHADHARVLWIDLGGYSEDELRDVAQDLELDSAGVRAAVAPWQRPSVDSFANHAFVNVTTLDVDLDGLTTVAHEIDCFIGERFVLIAHREELPFFDQMKARAETNAAIIAEGPAYLLYVLLDELVDDFAAVAEELETMIEEIEVEALTAESSDFIDRLVRHKRFVYSVGRLVNQHGFVFHGLLRPDFPYVSGPTIEGYFAELNSRFATVASTFDQARQEMLGAFDIYMSSVAHRTNGVMKLLTIISVLVLPASALFGFFGTNFVQLPFFGTAGLIGMLVLLFVLTVGQIILFRRRGWLS